MKKWILAIFISKSLMSAAQLQADSLKKPDTLKAVAIDSFYKSTEAVTPNYKKRKLTIAGVHTTAYAGTLLLLSQAWYKDYPKSSFHTFNDSKEWLQLDKIGHAWTAYNIANYSSDLWRWAGFSPNQSVILGGASSIGYQTILELLDAHSAEWGWSWTDVGANIFGAGLFSIQELAWKEQRFQFKFSSHPVSYNADLDIRANVLYGKSFQERLLKDYNGQTYWLSINIKSFARETKLPVWLNIAVGYGARGVFGGFENRTIDKNGTVTFDRSDIARERQWYLSPDIDFTKIKTNKQWVRSTLSVLNMLKFPAPALELTNGKLRGRLFYF